MDKILVTGGAGFIGSHLVDRLVELGKDIVALDNFDPQVHQGKRPDYLNPNARYIEGDVRDEKVLKKALENVGIIFHLAAKVGVAQSMYEIKEYVSANTFGTAFLWDYIINRRLGVKKFIVASSMSIYGEGLYACAKCGQAAPYLRSGRDLEMKRWEIPCPECAEDLKPIPTSEDKKLLPTSIYAITKKDQEEISLNLGTSYKIPTVALRFFNVYGPRQSLSNPYTGACAIFSSRVKNDRAPLIYEDGNQRRDFINVKDIVSSCVLAMNSEKCDYNFFNVGTGRAVSIKEAAGIIINLYAKDLTPKITKSFRVGDIRHCYADIAKFKEIGFSTKIKLEDGLKSLVEWSSRAQATDNLEKADLELERRRLKI